MSNRTAELCGVITAVLTPFDEEGKPDLDRMGAHIQVLERDGCDGILLLGTTGEGPSLSVVERRLVLEAGLSAAGSMRVVAHTGCASLLETADLTRHAYNLGVDAVVVMPPFFFKGLTDEGLYDYYAYLLDKAVPADGRFYLYHIPQVTAVPITFRLLDMLLKKDPVRVAGIKDSAGDVEHLRALCRRFPSLRVFTGNDQLILDGLCAGAVGCVTGVVNAFAPQAVDILRAFHSGNAEAQALQDRFTRLWKILDRYQPYPTLLKALLAQRYQDAAWLRVRPPLTAMLPDQFSTMLDEIRAVDLPVECTWVRAPVYHQGETA